MSNSPSDLDTPPFEDVLFSFVCGVMLILVFCFIAKFSFVPAQSKGESVIDTERQLLLAEVKEEAYLNMHTYALVNKDKKIYQVPVQRAMELVVEQYQNKK